MKDPNVSPDPGQNLEYKSNISDNEDEIVFAKSKKKVLNLSDSDSDSPPITSTAIENDNSDSEHTTLTASAKNSRIKIKPINTSESDESDNSETLDKTSPTSGIVKSLRIKDRDAKLGNKFKKSFMKKIERKSDQKLSETVNELSDVTGSSVQNTKISGLYDSESSDEEPLNNDYNPNDEKQTHSDEDNTKNMTKAKIPQRMSAKQAMEQMQKIKSESSRMLREKRFHLPYHRPKQISLKDIMNKKKIEFNPGAKKLTLRMNEEQLIEFAQQLEKKEKEMIELFKNDSDDENISDINNEDSMKNVMDTDTQELLKSSLQNESDDLKLHSSETASNDKLDGDIEMNNLVVPTINSVEVDNDIISDEKNDDIDNSLTDLLKETIDFVNNYETNKDELQTLEENDSESFNNVNNPSTSKVIQQSESQPTTRKKILDIIACSLPVKPMLSGTPGSFIDLTPDTKEVLSGVDLLKKKYLFHSSMKTPEELEREQEQKILPGTAFMNLRRGLEEQISQRRLEEWNKKREDDLLKMKENNELDDELSECEQILEKEKDLELDSCKDDVADNSNESESEEEDDDIPIKSSKKKDKCDLIEDEAELDDDDPSSDENDSDNDEDDNDDNDDNQTDNIIKPFESKKKLTRIYKAFSESSDEEESESKNKSKSSEPILKPPEVISTPIKTLDTEVDIFESQDVNKSSNDFLTNDSDDYLPPGQRYMAKTQLTCPDRSDDNLDSNPLESKEGSNLSASLMSPLLRDTSFNSTASNDNESPNKKTPVKRGLSPDKRNDLHKKLFIEQEPMDTQVMNSQDIAELCSGKFPTQSSNEIHIDDSVSLPYSKNMINNEMSQNTEMELLELCSGKFEGIDTEPCSNIEIQTDLSNYSSTKNIANSQELFADESMPQSKTPSNDNVPQTNSAEILNTTNKSQTTKCDNVILPTKTKKTSIRSFFLAKSNDKKEEQYNSQAATVIEKCDETIVEKPLSPPKGKFVIMSSSDENEEKTVAVKNKVRLSIKDRNKKLRAKPLEISDDESDNENDDSNISFSDVNSNESIKDVDDKDVEYDSEENEIEIINKVIQPEPKKKKTSEFFDQEAELTSEDEWKGSGDEDERGLDELEWEEGDADNIDQKKVNKELERIHRHQMLDQDKREIKLLQDILLEDGDLEGGTRERKFKWKNVDDTVESGAIVGDENPDENVDEVQNEEQWRRQRHERETFLREMLEKENLKKSETTETTPNVNVRMSIIKGTLNSNLKFSKWNNISPNLHKDNDTILKNTPDSEMNLTKKNSSKDLPSPVKTPLRLIQPGFKGSFLTRGQAALNRLALLTKSGGLGSKEDDTKTNLNTKRGNFVFTTVSPPCNKVADDENTKKTKRKASLPTTPLLIKKVKLAEDDSKFKKSLFDHIE